MTDHRRLQRTLFRMQLDPSFARRVFARELAALESTGLEAIDLELLWRADPRAVAADPGGRRRVQVLGNAASEFTASLAAAASHEKTRELLQRFASSSEMHTALMREGALPLAFAEHARRVAEESGDELLGALVELEGAMAHLRRAHAADPELQAGAIGLAGRARILSLRAGTHAAASALRGALDEQDATPRAGLEPGSGEERLLLFAAPRESALRLPEISVERLPPPADELFLLLAHRPRTRAERALLARAQGASAADLEAFLAGFVAEGVLLSG